MIFPWHNNQWSQVGQLITAGRMPHAMFLQGNQGLGKSEFAHALAHAVLCQSPLQDHRACGSCTSCKLLAAGTHPDLHHLQPVAKENSTSKKPALSIRIENIRALIDTLNQTSQFNGYRVAIIDQAEQMTLAAANSLLKTLEEPGREVLMILVSARAHRLPITIRSRCQALRFNVPEQGQAMQWLLDASREQQLSATEAQLKLLLKQHYGAPLTALNSLQQLEQSQLLAEALTAAVSGKNSLDYAAKLAKFNKVEILESMLGWVSDLGKLTSCNEDTSIINDPYRDKLQQIASKTSQQRLFRFYDQVNSSLSHSAIAVNEQLLWENLLLSWDNM